MKENRLRRLYDVLRRDNLEAVRVIIEINEKGRRGKKAENYMDGQNR